MSLMDKIEEELQERTDLTINQCATAAAIAVVVFRKWCMEKVV